MSSKALVALVLLTLLSVTILGLAFSHLLVQPVFMDVGTPGDSLYLHGFYDAEHSADMSYRWTSGQSSLLFPNRGNIPFSVSIAADAPRPEGQPQPAVTLMADGQLLGRFVAEAGIRDYSFQYVPTSLWPVDLILEIQTETFSPAGDPRDLGLLVNSVSLTPATSLPFASQPAALWLCVIPGLALILFTYLILCQADVSWKVALILALLLLALLAWGVLHEQLSMRLTVGLAVAAGLVCGLMAVVRGLGWRDRLTAWVSSSCSRMGASLGRTWRHTRSALSWQSIRSLGPRLGKWWTEHRWDVLIGVILFTLAILVRLPYYLEVPHVTDEFREVQIATEVAQGTYYPLFFSTTDYLGVVHSYLLGMFFRLAGISLYTPRLYMVIMGALAVVLTYWWAREMGRRGPALLAAGLMLTSPMHIVIGSHVAWMNCTTPVFCLLMWIAFYRGIVNDSGLGLALSGFFAGIALQTHPIIALLFPGMIIWYFLEQKKKGRPLTAWLRRPSVYVALALFLLTYGNIIWYNAQGRLHILAAAQRRDTMHQAPLDVWLYLEALRNLLQNLLSSLSGTFDLRLAPEVFSRPSMVFYGLWLVAGLLHALRQGKAFLFLLVVFPVFLLPFANQNYTIPDKSRYLSFLLPVCYIAMSDLVMDIYAWARIKVGTRAPSFYKLASAAILFLLIAYPLWPVWRFYQDYQDTEWSSRSVLQTAAALQQFRGGSLPIYIDAGLNGLGQPIIGSTVMKSLEYVLFLDGTLSEVVSFVPKKNPPRTFNHEVEFLSPESLPSPAVWVLARDTWQKLTDDYHADLQQIPGPGNYESRYGLYTSK